jgi:FkbH-like protein
VQELESLLDAGDSYTALRRIGQLAIRANDYRTIAALEKCRRRLRKQDPDYHPDGHVPVRIALLGNATTTFIAPHLDLLLEAHGITPVIHETGYDAMAWEFLNPDSETAAFDPQVAVVVQSPFALTDWPTGIASRDDAEDWCRATVDNLLAMFDAARRNMNCDMIIDTLHPFPVQPYGNLGATVPGDRNALLRKYNLALAERAPDYLYLHDVDALAGLHGQRHWVDQRFWHQAKQPMSFQSMVPYVQSLARMIAAMFRGSRKCLILDLDNTLWGGVVGDDGIAGIAIGPGNPVGEAFASFQDYIKQLGDRGVILAVCSKNEEKNAREPFESLSDMVLSLDDFAAFKANWDPKPENIRRIADELNIGLDSMVFVDDNPAERAIVEQMLPEVAVVELSEEPAEYTRLLDSSGWFEPVRLSAEDAMRTRQYQQNTERARIMETANDYDSYLRSLDQNAVIGPFVEQHIDRITQLVNKTNQFNLTTIRHNRAEISERMQREDYVTVYVRLSDRFGDNGLISVCYGKRESDCLNIEQWLMSCRVFKRGVEDIVMNFLVEQARAMDITVITGRYAPTEKNGLVSNLYATMGFEKTAESEDGSTEWRLVLDRFELRETTIKIIDE